MSSRPLWFKSIFLFVAAVSTVLFFVRPMAAEVVDKTAEISGTKLDYKVVLPKEYDPAKAYPAILAFGGGSQTMEMVQATLRRNWLEQAETQGYIVILPAAPDGDLFFESGDRVFPAFIVKILADYKIQQNKLHIAGVSNGGLSAFHIASLYPQYFWSVTGLPGFLDDPSPEHLRALSKLCIYMYAGEMDPGWLRSEQQQAAKFRSQGYSVEFSEEKGEGHVMRTLDGKGAARLFKQFEQARQGCAR